MKNIKSHTFNGRLYKIAMTGPIDGMTDTYSLNERIMVISSEPYTKSELETAVHESLHASNWAASEEVVTRVGRDVARFLWRLGYRRQK